MPEVRGGDRHKRQDKFRVAQTRKNPEDHTERGGNGEAIDEQIVRGGEGVAVSDERTAREHFGIVKRERRDKRERKPGNEPERRAAKQREQRHAARSVNFRRNILFGPGHSIKW